MRAALMTAPVHLPIRTSSSLPMRLGRYVLVESVGAGGMAEVFRATSVGSAGFLKQFAIKRVLPHLARDHAFVSLLIDEARIAATLSHPNILQVLDLGEAQGAHFIVMEFVAGRSLSKTLERLVRQGKGIPPGFSLFVVTEALRGLSFAHRKRDANGQPMGIIHRDVSPQNIMVSFDGSVKLADFGIARASERLTQTESDTIRGKPAYMAPEHVSEKIYDQRVDTYAMGVVLHEALAGKRMRVGSGMQLLVEAARGEFPTFEQQGAQVDAALASVVYRALARQPDDRFTDADELCHALDEHARRLGLAWTRAQVAQLMRSLFPDEVEAETRAEELALRIGRQVAEGDPAPSTESAADAPVTMTTTTRRRSRGVTLGAGLLFLAGVASAAAVATMYADRREPAGPAPVAIPPPAPAIAKPPPAPEPPPPTNLELAFTSEPPGALVTVDGRPLGVTPVRGQFPKDAELDVKVTRAGYRAEERRVHVGTGGPEVTFGLTRESARPARKAPGRLTLRSNPSWAKIYIDGKDTGRYTFVADMPVPAGRHSVKLVNDEQGLSVSFPIDVPAGGNLSLEKDLK